MPFFRNESITLTPEARKIGEKDNSTNIKNKKEFRPNKYIDITGQIPVECVDCMLVSSKRMITENTIN